MGLAEEERGERPLGLVQVLDRGADVAEEVVGDAELEVDLLLLRPGGDREPLLKRVEDFLEVADLRPALGQPLAELAHHAAFEVLALDQKRPQIDEGFRHELPLPRADCPTGTRGGWCGGRLAHRWPGLAARRQIARDPAKKTCMPKK